MEATKKVAGRYVIQEPLGKGGMGAVWRARDEILKRTIALKEVQIPASLDQDDGKGVHERVLREARAAARLTHPSATTVYDVFQDEGRTFIAMELVDAPTLAELVTEHGPLEPDEVARIGLALLDALDAAHDVGMVHRDVKPDNVMVTDTGQVKLTDFGIASVKGDARLTMSGVILGSPSYMAPEQADGRGADKEADLWSLGATLFFAVEGRPPFAKNSPIATLASVVDDPAPESARASSLGPVIRRLLEKDPAARLDSLALRPELERVAEGGYSSGATQVLEQREATEATPAPRTERDRVVGASVEPSPGQRKRSAALLVAGLAALLLLGAIAFALIQGDEESGNPNQRAGGSQAQDNDDAEGDNVQDDTASTEQEGWTTHEIADTGYQISYPEDWDVSESGAQTTFSDPGSPTSMLVEYTTSPGDDAVAAWEAQAAEFSASHEGYEEITIEPTSIEGFDTSAIWEFTYVADGLPMHAIDIGMAGDDIGFALFFQTSEDSWDQEQETLQQFRDSFGPAG